MRRCRKDFGCKPEEVFPSSTGIIGVPLPAEKLIAALPDVAKRLSEERESFQEVAQAILTTDTVEKTASARFEIDGKEVRITGVCKGSGMIHPQLVPHATMLVYLMTDAVAGPAVLDGYLRQAVELSFNRISVDGDTSTNDTVLLWRLERAARWWDPTIVTLPGRWRCVYFAGAPDRGRWRGRFARCGAAH